MSVQKAIYSQAFLSEEDLQITELARSFARKEIRPLAEKIDKEHYYPQEIIKKMSEMGFMGMMVDSKWGGSALSTLSYVSVLEEISVECASTAVIMSVNNSLVCAPIEKFGTEAQKEQYLTPLAQGKKLGCYCLSEPASGSDAAAMLMRAEKKGKNYILNGVKNFITNGKEADYALVYAVLNPELKHKGIVCFIVDAKSKGYQIAKLEDKLGIRGSSTAQIVFENVEVPEENLLGAENEGFKVAMNTLDGGRIGIATQALGISRACLEEALQYSLEREAFGKAIVKHGAIQNYIADMSTELDAARLLTRAAAHLKDRNLPVGRAASEAKLFAAETCMKTATKGIQVLGGYGYSREYAMERHFRDAKITEIYEGTSEIQRLVITSNLIKEIQS